MAGLIITPRAEDFRRIDATIIEEIYREVTCDETLLPYLLRQVERS
jgi:hypothetical protein